MKRTILALIASLAVLAPGAATARSDDPPPANAAQLAGINARMGDFFQGLQAGDVAGAYAAALEGSVVGGRTIEISQLASQTSVMVATYGALQSWELFDSQCSTPRVCLVKHAAYFERGAAGIWTYLYQTPTGDWIVTGIFVGDAAQFFFD